MSRYILSRRATADLNDIWDYTEPRWGLDQAEAYTDAMRKALKLVAEHPQSRRACNNIKPGYFKLSCGSHVIFYRLSGDDLFVTRILHQRMDFPRHL